jgi:hypothetical protein
LLYAFLIQYFFKAKSNVQNVALPCKKHDIKNNRSWACAEAAKIPCKPCTLCVGICALEGKGWGFLLLGVVGCVFSS